jgi:hypothetical protein
MFPGIGPMTDDEFIDLVRLALQSGYKVYVGPYQVFGDALYPFMSLRYLKAYVRRKRMISTTAMLGEELMMLD